MLVIWCTRTRYGEELALGPGPNLLGYTMEMPPVSSVGVNIRDKEWTVPSTEPESILTLLMLL